MKTTNTYANRGAWLESAVVMSSAVMSKRTDGILEKMPVEKVRFTGGANGDSKTVRRRSTVDFFGVIMGAPIAFDAKATKEPSIPYANVKEHQLDFLRRFTENRGLGCLLVSFEKFKRTYLCTVTWWDDQVRGSDRASIAHEAFRLGSLNGHEVVDVVHGGNSLVLDLPSAVLTLDAKIAVRMGQVR